MGLCKEIRQNISRQGEGGNEGSLVNIWKRKKMVEGKFSCEESIGKMPEGYRKEIGKKRR